MGDSLSFVKNDGSEQMGRGQKPEALLGTAGPVDPVLQTLSFVDDAGNTRGMIVNFGMHGGPAVGGGKVDFISADWPGELSRHLNLLYGPDMVALFLLGPCGDTWHLPYSPSLLPQGGPATAVALGRGLAGAAALRSPSATRRRVSMRLAGSPSDSHFGRILARTGDRTTRADDESGVRAKKLLIVIRSRRPLSSTADPKGVR